MIELYVIRHDDSGKFYAETEWSIEPKKWWKTVEAAQILVDQFPAELQDEVRICRLNLTPLQMAEK